MSMLIIDYGGPTVRNISAILSDEGVSSTIIQPTDPLSLQNCVGIILSGGPDHVYETNARKLPSWIDQVNLPILGICYGMELIVSHFGGFVLPIGSTNPLSNIEYGPIGIRLINEDKLLGQLNSQVWMNHYDTVAAVPTNFKITSLSENGLISSLNDNKKWWGIQFHPENPFVLHVQIFKNFIEICRNY